MEANRVYVLQARDLDHALALAAMTPIIDGGVEVRPIADSFGIPRERPSWPAASRPA